MAESELKRTHGIVVIIGYVLVFVVLACAVAGELIHRGIIEYSDFVISPENQSYVFVRYALLVLAIGERFAAFWLSSSMLSSPKADNPRIALMSRQIMLYTFCIDPVIYGWVLYMLAGNITDIYIFCSISFVSLAIFFPRYDRWQEWAARHFKKRLD